MDARYILERDKLLTIELERRKDINKGYFLVFCFSNLVDDNTCLLRWVRWYKRLGYREIEFDLGQVKSEPWNGNIQ